MSTRRFKVALGLRKMTSLFLIEFARVVIKMLTGNLSVTTPEPPIADLKNLTDDYENTKQNLENAKISVKQFAAAEKQKRKLLERALSREATTVDGVAQGDKAIIESCGMPATNEPQRIHLGQVEELTLSHGDDHGNVEADWKPIAKAEYYTVRISHTAPDEHGGAKWEFFTNSAKSSASLTGFQSGSGLWVCVCANGRRNNGAFSEAKFIIVP